MNTIATAMLLYPKDKSVIGRCLLNTSNLIE